MIATVTEDRSVTTVAWPIVELGDVCDVQLGKMLSPKSKRGVRPVPYLRNENVQWNRFDLTDVAWMDFSETEEEKFRLRPGDLLVCEGGEPGRAAVWNGELERCCYQKALHRIRPREGLSFPPFLMYRLWMSALDAGFTRSHSKTTIAHLPREKLLRMRFPLPPYGEQKCIAAHLAEQLAIADAAKRAAGERLAAAEALSAAYVEEILNGLEAESWEERPLGDIVLGAGQYGTSQRSNTEGKGLPVLGMPHIQKGRIRWQNVSTVDLSPSETQKYELVGGDILFNRTNSAELVGKTAVFDGSRRAVFASYLIRYRANPSCADPHFISTYINSRMGRRFIEQHMARAIGQVNVSASTMHRMPIPCPPLETQQNLMASLSDRIRATKTLADSCRSHLVEIDAMPRALLRAAFQGEL